MCKWLCKVYNPHIFVDQSRLSRLLLKLHSPDNNERNPDSQCNFVSLPRVLFERRQPRQLTRKKQHKILKLIFSSSFFTHTKNFSATFNIRPRINESNSKDNGLRTLRKLHTNRHQSICKVRRRKLHLPDRY